MTVETNDFVGSHPDAFWEGYNRRFRRNIFTGQLEEVWDNPRRDFEARNRRNRAGATHLVTGRTGDRAWGQGDKVFNSLSLPPEQATPERVAHENEQARRHGTGAQFDGYGRCHVTGRGSRSREMRRQGRQDNDAGYGDYAGG